jgi:hypothetical protein
LFDRLFILGYTFILEREERALLSNINDYEDAVVAESEKVSGADYIITNNIKDFKNSRIKALRSEEYLAIIRAAALLLRLCG